MGNCCGGEPQHDIDKYIKLNHPTKLKYEKNNYELAQQDRCYEDKNMSVRKGDLGFLDAKHKGDAAASEI